MMIDFKEIPEANKGTGVQDAFELFTRDFLSFLGYRIVQDMDISAFEKMKKLFINTYPYVARHLTEKEKMRVKTLLMYGLI